MDKCYSGCIVARVIYGRDDEVIITERDPKLLLDLWNLRVFGEMCGTRPGERPIAWYEDPCCPTCGHLINRRHLRERIEALVGVDEAPPGYAECQGVCREVKPHSQLEEKAVYRQEYYCEACWDIRMRGTNERRRQEGLEPLHVPFRDTDQQRQHPFPHDNAQSGAGA